MVSRARVMAFDRDFDLMVGDFAWMLECLAILPSNDKGTSIESEPEL